MSYNNYQKTSSLSLLTYGVKGPEVVYRTIIIPCLSLTKGHAYNESDNVYSNTTNIADEPPYRKGVQEI
jgi:hypothetical protein